MAQVPMTMWSSRVKKSRLNLSRQLKVFNFLGSFAFLRSSAFANRLSSRSALVEQSTNGEQVVAKDVADDKTTNDDEAETKTGAKETDIAPSISESADGPLATPASASKGKGKRKSGGVPEHKSKKLSKKPSKARMTHIDAQPGDYFFIRLKGYPLWPGIIVDEEMLPPLMKKSRPVTGIRADGTYREGYEDGGTKAKDRTFPVMYLHTNELCVVFFGMKSYTKLFFVVPGFLTMTWSICQMRKSPMPNRLCVLRTFTKRIWLLVNDMTSNISRQFWRTTKNISSLRKNTRSK
jgi:hypothetical protein